MDHNFIKVESLTITTPSLVNSSNSTNIVDTMIDYLTNNNSICFKSQQINESDLNKKEKSDIAIKLFNTSKLNFLLRFGKYLSTTHLTYLKEQFKSDNDIKLVLNDLIKSASNNQQLQTKNRRYAALKQMLDDDHQYFSETEMMKRNPLLYDQLVGQYLSEEEKRSRDRLALGENLTLVQVLMEGIEREDAEIKRKSDEMLMMKQTQPLSSNENCDNDGSDDAYSSIQHYTQWGEFHDDVKVIMMNPDNNKNTKITIEEQQLMRSEFVSMMYQQFLDGKEVDYFDYELVDTDDKYDTVDFKEHDDEDRYFDSEEPNDLMVVEMEKSDTTSNNDASSEEDELDIFMNGLNQSTAISEELSKDMQKL